MNTEYHTYKLPARWTVYRIGATNQHGWIKPRHIDASGATEAAEKAADGLPLGTHSLFILDNHDGEGRMVKVTVQRAVEVTLA